MSNKLKLDHSKNHKGSKEVNVKTNNLIFTNIYIFAAINVFTDLVYVI